MRYVFRIGFALALGLALMAGCSDENGEGGSGGTAGVGGNGGHGGSPVACVDLVCPCTEAGIRAAIAEGGGPFTFDCDGSTTVVAEAVIEIDKDVVLDGEGRLTVDGNGAHHVFSVNEQWMSEGESVVVTAELKGFTMTNSGDSYVGIANRGRLTVTDSSVSGNGFAGISTNGRGRLLLANSTVSRNAYFGIHHMGRELSVTNSTVSRNTIGIGGTTSTSAPGMVATHIVNATISENTGCIPTEGGCFDGGIWVSGLGTIASSILSGNGEDGLRNCQPLGFESGGHNIESPGDTCGLIHETDQVDVSADDLNLGPLANNGGSTMTHALLTEPTISVAIDAIPVEDCVDSDEQRLTEDQRGELRPETGGTRCDVGAFELQP